ncbi:unnamed protein product [Heligmosomoides polygyrus]|uniref:TIL domain-containing protein n=1 Tax=Heligmosomoides polygyrus TaxID=6339 RepID=A0A183FQC2_HELPZ|nr:unnamed protein product [Heligmosomoides polygyrus]
MCLIFFIIVYPQLAFGKVCFQPCPRMCKSPQCQCPTHKGFRRDKKGDCVRCD